MMGRKRGRKPGSTSSPAPLQNDYAPSAFVSGDLPTNNGASKTGPKFGPRIASLEEEMDLFQEKIDGLGYEHKILMAEINIINDWIKEQFGVQLINQDSQILKFLQLSDGIQDLSKALALPRAKSAQHQQQQPLQFPCPKQQPMHHYDDDYAGNDQYQYDQFDQYQDYQHHGGGRKNPVAGILGRDLKITKYTKMNRTMDMNVALAPNQPLVFDQNVEAEEEDMMIDDLLEADNTEQQEYQADYQADYQAANENDDINQREEAEDDLGDHDEVDGTDDQDQETEETDDIEAKAVITDQGKHGVSPKLVSGKALDPEMIGNDDEVENFDGHEDEEPMNDGMNKDNEEDDRQEATTPTTEDVKDEQVDEDSKPTNMDASEPEPSSRSRSGEQNASPDRSNSRTRTRIAKAPKRYRDEDEPTPVVKHSKPKARMINTPKTPLGKPIATQPVQQRRKSIGATSATKSNPGPGLQKQTQNLQRFNCMFPDCGKYFPTKDQLTKHHQLHKAKPADLTAEDIEKLTCEYCHKIFSSTWNLKTHYRTHTGEKPYPCNYCGQRFAYNQSREQHERHNHTLERPFVCNFCGKSFCASGELGSHLGRVHQRSYQENKQQLLEMEKYDQYDGQEEEEDDEDDDDDDGPPQLSPSAPMPQQGQPQRPGQQQRGEFTSHFLCYD